MKWTAILVSITLFCNTLVAQNNKDNELDYRRSSLHLIMMEFEDYEAKRAHFRKCFNLVPFPDKYNEHNIVDRFFKYKDYNEYVDNSMKGKNANIFKAESSIEQFFDEKEIAKKLIAKWFMRDPITGAFSMDLIKERGLYNASELDKSIANNSLRGNVMLADAGENLITNTFVVVCKVRYIAKEETARIWTEGFKEGAAESNNGTAEGEAANGLINLVSDIFYNKTKDGYEVKTDAFLYRLVWNEEIENIFYNDYWINKGEVNQERKEKFDKTYLFELEYVGMQSAIGKVLFSSKDKTKDRIIEIATVRNINNVFTKLQKEYDVFKTKTPIISVDPLAAEIGMKEGLEKGDKFEVLESKLDLKTGKVNYLTIGTAIVSKEIWDNRYGADENPKEKLDKAKYTIFKGFGKFYPGLLLRQIK